MEETVEEERSVINATLELRIKDFSTATEKSDVHQMHHDEKYDFQLCASVYPNGVNEDTQGWVVVISSLNDKHRGIDEKTSYLAWTVSIIDIEGNMRFPRSFEKSSADHDFMDAKYLKKSFILNNGDELLSEGALLLRCDVSFDFKREKSIRMWKVGDGSSALSDGYVQLIFGYRPQQVVCSENSKEKGYPRGIFKAYEFTPKAVNAPKFRDLGKSSGVYLVYDGISPPSSDREDVWKFDTRSDRFLLSLKENVGSRLVESSPFIRRCINVPMKEKQEKCVELTDVETETFKNVLYFLESGELRNDRFEETVEVYKFSHLYGMENLQQKCAEHLVAITESESDLEVIHEIADFYTDENLLKLLKSRQQKYGYLKTRTANDRPDSNSFI